MSGLSFLLDGCGEIERTARLRELRALTAVYCGFDHPAKAAFDAALSSGSFKAALDEIERLPALRRRRLLASYGALQQNPQHPAAARSRAHKPDFPVPGGAIP